MRLHPSVVGEIRMSTKLMPEKLNLESRKATIYLPDFVMIEILSRLPTESIFRFMYACKLWNSLVSDYYFMTSQLKNRPTGNHPGVVFLKINSSMGHFWLHLYNERRRHLLKFCIKDLRSFGLSYNISNSCNGLISVFGWDSAFLVNPITREFLMLPKVSPHHRKQKFEAPIGGLAFDASTGKYKIVRFFVEQRESVLNCMCCEILTLGSDLWKRINSIQMFGNDFAPHGAAPVIVNGVWHWAAENFKLHGKDVVALALHIGNETLDEIQHPDGSRGGRRRRPDGGVGELGGYLCVLYHTIWAFQPIEVWLLKDYDKRLWVKQYNLFVPRKWDLDSFGYIRRIKPLAFCHGKSILHAKSYCAVGWSLYCYDMEKQTECMLEHRLWKDATLHTESFVSPRVCAGLDRRTIGTFGQGGEDLEMRLLTLNH